MKIIKRLLYACKAALKFPNLYPVGRFPNLDIDSCVENYIKHIESARYYANLLGARYLNFLQPFNGGGRRKLSRFDIHSTAHISRRLTFSGENEYDLIVKFYDGLWPKVKHKGYVFDLRNIFDNYEGEIYFDQVHCSDIGYDIIAERIAEQIIKSEDDNS